MSQLFEMFALIQLKFSRSGVKEPCHVTYKWLHPTQQVVPPREVRELVAKRDGTL